MTTMQSMLKVNGLFVNGTIFLLSKSLHEHLWRLVQILECDYQKFDDQRNHLESGLGCLKQGHDWHIVFLIHPSFPKNRKKVPRWLSVNQSLVSSYQTIQFGNWLRSQYLYHSKCILHVGHALHFLIGFRRIASSTSSCVNYKDKTYVQFQKHPRNNYNGTSVMVHTLMYSCTTARRIFRKRYEFAISCYFHLLIISYND